MALKCYPFIKSGPIEGILNQNNINGIVKNHSSSGIVI